MKRYPWLFPHFKKLIFDYQFNYKNRALLIYSTPGMGVDSLIYSISCFLICQKTEKYEICSKCQNCRLMKEKIHPDFYHFDSKKEKKTLGIDEVREINEKINKHATLDGAKVIWLKDATYITNSAANGLLKIIEENPEKTWFFFSCYEPKKVLVTLRSRCQLYYIDVPNEIWSMNWIKKKVTNYSKETILSSLRICNGAPLLALLQLQPEIWYQRKILISRIESISKNNNWITLLDILVQKKSDQKLYWLASIMLDIMKLQNNITMISNIDCYILIKKLIGHFSDGTISIVLHKIYKVYQQLLSVSGYNNELLLSNLLLDIENFCRIKKL